MGESLREKSDSVNDRRTVERLERTIATTLLTGVILSAAVILFGLAITMTRHADRTTSSDAGQWIIQGEYRFSHSLTETWRGLSRLEGRSVITLGLLILMATPVARVALCLALFAAQGERAYTIFTGVVFLLLLVSFLLGKAG